MIAAGVPLVASAGNPTAAMVAPSPGTTVVAGEHVTLSYTGYSAAARNISGYLTLDGVAAGTFVTKTGGPNGTTLNVTLRPEAGTGSGAHALGARVFTEIDGPVDAAEIQVVLDLPPRIEAASAWYDRDARRLHLNGSVADDFDATISIYAGVLGWTDPALWAMSVPAGAFSIVRDIHLAPGEYAASLVAFDSHGGRAQASPDFTIEDRPTVVHSAAATYRLGGSLDVVASLEDQDGVRQVFVSTPLGSGLVRSDANTTTYRGALNVTPRLGTFPATLHVIDANERVTQHNFTFEITGERVTLVERTVTTALGTHSDASAYELPAALGGLIEICMPSCGETAALGSAVAGPLDASCSAPEACRALRGDPAVGTLLRPPCGRPEPRNSDGIQHWLAWWLVRTADDGRSPSSTRGPFGTVLPPPAIDLPLIDESPKICRDQFAALGATGPAATGSWVVAQGANRTSAMSRCIAPSSTVCAFEATTAWQLDVAWLQGADQEVTLRVSGVRV